VADPSSARFPSLSSSHLLLPSRSAEPVTSGTFIFLEGLAKKRGSELLRTLRFIWPVTPFWAAARRAWNTNLAQAKLQHSGRPNSAKRRF